MNSAADLGPAGPAEFIPAAPEPEASGKKRWRRSRWLILIALAFGVHVGFLFTFGTRKPITPRAVTNVPTLALAPDTGEWLALTDPTLFALPHSRDLMPVLRVKPSAFKPPSFRWIEPSGWLLLSAENLVAVFDEFMQTNRFAELELQLKPAAAFSYPAQPIELLLPQASALEIADGLAQRLLLTSLDLPSWPYADVIAPTHVQALVNPAGEVISTALLPPDSRSEAATRYDAADQLALVLARTARFAPAPQLTLGRLIFHWHTVPITNTNEPAR